MSFPSRDYSLNNLSVKSALNSKVITSQEVFTPRSVIGELFVDRLVALDTKTTTLDSNTITSTQGNFKNLTATNLTVENPIDNSWTPTFIVLPKLVSSENNYYYDSNIVGGNSIPRFSFPSVPIVISPGPIWNVNIPKMNLFSILIDIIAAPCGLSVIVDNVDTLNTYNQTVEIQDSFTGIARLPFTLWPGGSANIRLLKLAVTPFSTYVYTDPVIAFN